VDGTMYRKDKVYNPSVGSIQTAHDFFRYGAHNALTQGEDPAQASSRLVSEYQNGIKNGTIPTKVAGIDESVREEWDALVEQYGSNGRVFDNHHRLKEQGVHNYLHRMIAQIDFTQTLVRDEQLSSMFEDLVDKGYTLGIVTSEVHSTVVDVAKTLGFDMSLFHIGVAHPETYSRQDGRFYPIMCRNNHQSKPSLDGFEKIMRLTGCDDPNEFVYIGDSIKKDIIPPLRLGWSAIHVVNDTSDLVMKEITVDNQTKDYTQIGSVYQIGELF